MDPATVQPGGASLVLQALAAAGALIAAIATAIGFFIKLLWDKHVRADEARQKQKAILYESLRWFEGRTQNRSIGISVVHASWNEFPELHAIWIEVLANQAVYLLTASKQGERLHEHDNLRRILEILQREYAHVLPGTKNTLDRVIKGKLHESIRTGLSLTPELKDRLTRWPEQGRRTSMPET